MAFLTINELTIPVAAKEGDSGWVPLDDIARGVTGDINRTRIDEKVRHTLRTPVLPQQTGRALMALLRGHGHNWTYDADLYSDGTGVPVASGTTSGAGSSTHTTKFGNYLELSAAEQLTYDINLGSRYTVMFWLWDGVSAWDHYIFDDAGNKWKNGATHGSAITEVTVSSNDLVVGDGTNADDVDDVVVLKERIPSAWATGDWGPPTQAFSDLPNLLCDGTLFDDVQTECIGMSVSARLVGFHDTAAAAWDPAGHVLTFTLEET